MAFDSSLAQYLFNPRPVVPHALPPRWCVRLDADPARNRPRTRTAALDPGERLFLSAGLGWTACHCRFTGGQLRAEYSLTPIERVVGLRVHLGTFWTPTQSYSRPSILYGEGSSFEGVGQTALVDLGVTGSITPWPRGRVSPYAVAGVAVLQTWRQGSGYYRHGDGSVAEFVPPGSGTHGDIRAIVGAGLRVRVGGRLLQLEARELRGSLSVVSLGTALHF